MALVSNREVSMQNLLMRIFEWKAWIFNEYRIANKGIVTSSQQVIFLSADPCKSSTASYRIVDINLNLLSLHVVTVWRVFGMTFLEIQFSEIKIFKTQTPCLLKKYYISHSQAVWNLISIYLQWNRIYILCISSIYSISTSISMLHHKWPACDLLTLENFLLAACLLRLNHILIRLTPENFYRTKLQKVWSINSRTKIGFEWF